jgi:hypothetical protein
VQEIWLVEEALAMTELNGRAISTVTASCMFMIDYAFVLA